MRDVVHDGRTFLSDAVTVLPFRQTKFFKNNFEKPLDNQHKMCYNDKAVRDRNPLLNKMGGEPTAEYERSLYD